MSLFIKKCGILTTVQDLGRFGSMRFGVNPTGAMDRTAVRLINILLGNNENEAVLEMHFPAPEIAFENDAAFAIGGAEFSALLNDQPIDNWQSRFAESGSTLKFRERKLGNRAYLAVRGGFAAEEWLGSKSTNLIAGLGGFSGRALKNDDMLPLNSVTSEPYRSTPRVSTSIIPRYGRYPTVRVVAGGEFESLTNNSKELFFNEGFTVTKDSNRMGFRLDGPPLRLQEPLEMISSAVNFGTIQLLPDGQLIVLMADHQTSGGYPRIANVISRDLPVLAQLGPNDKVSFQLVSIQNAERLALEFENERAFLKTGVRFLNV